MGGLRICAGGMRCRQLHQTSSCHLCRASDLLGRTSHICSTGRGGRASFQCRCGTNRCACSGGSPNRCSRSQASCCEGVAVKVASFSFDFYFQLNLTRVSLEVIFFKVDQRCCTFRAAWNSSCFYLSSLLMESN